MGTIAAGTTIGAGSGSLIVAGVEKALEGGGWCEATGERLSDLEVEGAGALEIEPVSRSIKFAGAVLPEKNSGAVSAGVDDGAGGKMSAWKESALTKRMCQRLQR